MTRRHRKIVAIAVGAASALLAAWALVHTLGATSLGPIRGLRLGYTAVMARARFEAPGPGDFRSEADGEDLSLIWTSRDPAAAIASATMEFHLGQLVALRMRVRGDQPEAIGPPVVASDTSLLAREPEGASVSITWLARACPTHADEVRRRLAQAQ